MTALDPTTTPITADLGGPPERPIRFRRTFDVGDDLSSAVLRITALGIYEAECNGTVVGDRLLEPGWTAYAHRIRVVEHDVTDLLRAGANALGITVAEGWYRGRLGFHGGAREVYGTEIGPVAELRLTHGDGSTEIIGTDTDWRAGYGPHKSAGLYDGEHFDARAAEPTWSTAQFDDTAWAPVRTLEPLGERAIAHDAPPVRRVDEVAVAEVISSPSGATILDIGQNISGWMRLTVSGPAGTEITLRHAEVLEDGELGTRPLRGAAQTDTFVLAGDGTEVHEPTFTVHGFRYVQVDGWPGEIDPAAFTAVVCHSDMTRTGWFECSHPGLSKLHENIVWSFRGNVVDLPTDCPQRDERLGWTGDIQVFAPAASFLYDTRDFLASWLRDLAADQADLGTVPVYIPWIQLLFPAKATAAWGDAAVIVPWVMFEHYGDAGVLREQYPSMRAWVDEIADRAGDTLLWDSDMQLGDWLDPSAPPDQPWAARTDANLVATAYLAHSARLLAKTATELGETADAGRYHQLADDVTVAFRAEYVTANGRLTSDSPTAYALALTFELLADDAQRTRAAARLDELVRRNSHHIATGFVGTPIMCQALLDNGHADTAYHLLLQDTCPSWLYPVSMGATTVWERWDSMLPDGSINPGEMTSFNHYALGAVATFLHRTVAGLAPAAPGYRRLRIAPRPGGGLTSAAARLDTVHGRADVAWTRSADTLTVEVTVPDGCTAEVDIPGCATTELGAGRHTLTAPWRPAADDPPLPGPWSPLAELAD